MFLFSRSKYKHNKQIQRQTIPTSPWLTFSLILKEQITTLIIKDKLIHNTFLAVKIKQFIRLLMQYKITEVSEYKANSQKYILFERSWQY